MKILSGQLKGRPFDQPKTSVVRPLSDKVRAALFDVIGSVTDATVLDVYAGSGAAGFEALSRGAAMVEAIEGSRTVSRTIEANAAKLELNWGFVLYTLKIETWLALPRNQPDSDQPQARYNLIIVDPPYAQLNVEIIQHLAAFLLPGGILVVSHSSRKSLPVIESIELVQSKHYGDTALSFYQAP